jgi:hypothetical protein
MANTSKNKHYLMLCELHFPEKHGKTEDSYPNIESHYLVYDRFDPITGISFSYLEEYGEYDTDSEYDSDSDSEFFENTLVKIDNQMAFLKRMYSNSIIRTFGNHPTIRNYHNIISNPNYIKPEIGEYIILPTQECIAILKTFWLRIIQKKWKKVFLQRKNIIKKRHNPSSLFFREINGTWDKECSQLPGLKGLLYDLKVSNYKNKNKNK